MKQVAKLVVVAEDNNYLMLIRNNHPEFGDDFDLPGGTLEEGENRLNTVIREVEEEIGLKVKADDITEIFSSTKYSKSETLQTLYLVKLSHIPQVKLSWEHSSYKWLDETDFIQKAKNAKDPFMHMVYKVMK